MRLLQPKELKSEMDMLRDSEVRQWDDLKGKINKSTKELAKCIEAHAQEQKKHNEVMTEIDTHFQERNRKLQEDVAVLEERKQEALKPVDLLKEEWKKNISDAMEQHRLFQQLNADVGALLEGLNQQKERGDVLEVEMIQSCDVLEDLKTSHEKVLSCVKEELDSAKRIRESLEETQTLSLKQMNQWQEEMREKQADLDRERQSLISQKEELQTIQARITDDRIKLKQAMDLWRQEQVTTISSL